MQKKTHKKNSKVCSFGVAVCSIWVVSANTVTKIKVNLLKVTMALPTNHSQPRNCHVNWLPQSSSNDTLWPSAIGISFDELWGNQFTWQFLGCEWEVVNATLWPKISYLSGKTTYSL